MRSPMSQPTPFARIEVWLLAAVLVWSFLFRLWFGLTDFQYRHYWDEHFSFDNSLSLLRGRAEAGQWLLPAPVVRPSDRGPLRAGEAEPSARA